MRKPYPSDLTDEQWAVIEPLIPVHKVGRPRTNPMREVLNAIFWAAPRSLVHPNREFPRRIAYVTDALFRTRATPPLRSQAALNSLGVAYPNEL